MRFNQHQQIDKKYGTGGDWLNLQEGGEEENFKIRIVTEFEDYGVHRLDKESVICLGKENCIHCQEGTKVTVQFLGWVIDRRDNSFKLLRIGHQINKKIGVLSENEQYKFEIIPNYDITINRKGKLLETKYDIIADRNDTPLTEQELEKIKTLKPSIEIIDAMKNKLMDATIGTNTESAIPVIQENAPIQQVAPPEDINPDDIPF